MSAEPQPSYEELAAENAQLGVMVELLRAEVVELKAQMGKNSSNSSKPPSGDGLDTDADPQQTKGSDNTMPKGKVYRLLGADREIYESAVPGALGGYRPRKIYGRLDCRSALRAIAQGGYVSNRVFFAEENTALDAGYRPCARRLPAKYRAWKRGTDPRTVQMGSR